jgi:amino acid adenylation domain-containing protein/non-ribosomal peptide synthase protein (TIGR01720 family)
MGKHFQELVKSVLKAPFMPVKELNILPSLERHNVLVAFNDTACEYPRHQSITFLFEQQVVRVPNSPAAICGDTVLTYRQLNELANRIATYLLTQCSLEPEELVAVVMDRSEWTIVALTGILKGGGAYLPIDPSYPSSRIAYILKDTNCRVVISEEKYINSLLSNFPNINLIDIKSVESTDLLHPETTGTGSSLAYVIYTSGSTGLPKGVLINQRSVIRLILNTNYITIKEDDRILQTGSLAFDASTFEIWGALLNGACVCLPEENTLIDTKELKRLIQRHGITVMFLTTSLFNQLVEGDVSLFRGLQTLLTGGEKVSVHHFNKFRQSHPSVALSHVYGPTENTTFTTAYKVEKPFELDIPIGAPVANSTVYILDKNKQPLPVGIPGEICTGGDGVARGYLNQPAFTEEKFVPNPFKEHDRLYRTGDLGYWLPDGNIAFVERIDTQVKVRGFRVELGEIEYQMRTHHAVKEAVVLARQTTVGTKELIAYYVGAQSHGSESLRTYLAQLLPEYMVPYHIIQLERFPLTVNGKIDRQALPAPESIILHPDKTEEQPCNETQALLIQVLESVLGRKVRLQDNYFDLGGDSIRAIQIVNRLKQAGWHLEISDLFQKPTPVALSPYLRKTERQKNLEIISGPVRLTPIQHWFFKEHDIDLHHFNQSVLLQARERIDETALRSVLDKLQQHHDGLRMTYRQVGDKIEQVNAEDLPLEFMVKDLRDNPQEDALASMEAHANWLQRSFNLETGPLMKTVLYHLDQRDLLLMVIHHLVVDGLSWRILMEDLEKGYSQYLQGQEKAIDLGSKSTSFKAWASEQYAVAEAVLQEQKDYWSSKAGIETKPIPKDIGEGYNLYGDCLTVGTDLSYEQTKALLTGINHAYNTEINDILLTALGRALKVCYGKDKTWITMEGHGRLSLGEKPVDISRTVGWFTSVYPFLLTISGEDIGAHLKEVKEALREVPHQGVGFGILRYVSSQDLPLPPQPQVSFNYLGQFDQGGETGFFTFADDGPTGQSISPRFKRHHELDVSGIIFGNRLYLSILFSQGGHYHQDQMQILLSLFKEELLSVIKHCQNKKEREKTPSDFTERAFTLESYASFLESHCWKAWDIEDIYTLSPMQEGLLFQSLYEPHSKAYFLQMAFRVEEELHPELFKRSWDILVNRHPILRTAFVHEGLPRPLQVVFKHRSPEILFVDLQGLSKDEKRIKEYENQDMARGFDLERDPLMRITLLRLDTSLYHVVWSYHHIVLDGWSLGIVYREFTLIYKALINGKEPVLPAVPPYSDYIRWLKRQDKAVAKAYWLRYLFGYEQHVQLPRSLSARASGYSLKEMNFELSDRTSAALIELAARHKVTLNTIIQALWGLLLSRYNNIDDVVFGMIVSGRPSEVKGIEEMVGLFINALPVRIHYRPDQSFAALVQEEVQHSFIEGTSYHHLSLSEIQTLVPAGRELFDHLLIFENYPLDQGMGQGGEEDLNFTGLSVHDETHYDFNLIVIPGRPIQIRMSYNSLVYTPEEIEGIGVHLKTAIHSVLEDPAKVLSKIDIVPEKEKEQVLYGFNKTDVVCPKDKTIVDVFEAQVQQTPNAVAVVFENTSLTYHELNRWANAIAHYLREAHFLQPDDRVGLMVERSEAVVAAIFGILKAGGAYIPLDPDYPQERIRYILQDAQCAVILSEPKYIKLLSIHDSAPVIDLYHIDHANRGNPSRTVALENLAYVIYTSGSTGRPKGCQIEHGNLFHYLSWAARYYFLDNPESGYFALYSSLSFDLTVTSLFLPLLRGKTLYIFPQDMDLNDILLKNFSDNTPIDCIKLTPSHISLMKQINLSSTNIGLVIVGGESLLMEQVRLLQGLNPHMKIYNEYGPTETTVGCIVKHVRPQDQRVLIGKPIDNTHIYILDSHGWPVPLGVVGEIYIGGSGVCRGYLNQQWLNEERFITSPFVRGERLYKTGDLGRWLADGNIECLGRNDNQIKIRGYRIELEEIEQAIVEHEAVQKAVVLPLPDIRQKDKALVAYVVVDNEKLNSQKLRDYLKAMLPDYMIPSYFVKLDEIPLTPHGKVDKKALPDPVQEHLESRMAYVEPRNLLEKRLSQVWQSVLDVERIGIEDNFFELGGHSLKAMQIVSRIHKELGVKIGLKDFFNVPTVAQLAGLIMNQERIDSLKGIEPAPRQPYYELSHAQKRLWLLYRMKGEVAYNMPNAVLLEDTVDTEALDMAFHTIIERHEALRTGFIEVESEPKQVIHPDIVFTVKKIDLSGGAEAEKRGHAIADIEANTPFDLTKPPLLRATLIKLGEKRYVFLLTMHHIVGDGWSMNILYHELLALYEAYCLKKPNPLKPLRIQYKDFALWQNARGFDQEQKYWLSKLAGMPESLPLPYDFLPEEERSFHGDTKAIELDKDSVKQLQALAAKKNTTLSNVMLAIFKLFLFQLTRQHDMCIGISIANRNHPELENIIGFFVNILPIRTYLSEDMEFGELLDQVIQNTYEAFEHQDYPFDLLIQKLNPTRYANRQPIVNVIYGFQNFADVHIDIGDNDLRVKEKYFDPSMAFDFSFKTSKFDLTLFVFQEEDEALHLTLEYDTSLFLSKTIEQYLSILKRLANMLANQVTHGQVS